MTAIHRQRKGTVMTVMEKDNSMLTERKIAEFEQYLRAGRSPGKLCRPLRFLHCL